ncbi:C-terminal binding protein [Pantoea sp. At-9b]|uniref:C-terminal binding protein n=1 Tax=Pantoea sp. (strain At-9b) TaxID=592316 RepID=UPI0001B3F793|nr:C-terminal binding protein [Pantoea sp. At-9b]ADU71355.1 Phosphoglycerate dehydrogenase [Pantoea sp. At-9b]
MKKIVVLEPGYVHYREEEAILAAFHPEFVVIPTTASQATKLDQLRDADAVMLREARLDSSLIAALDKCQAIVRYGVGVDNVDLAAAKEKGIYVANVPDYGSEDVAEHALALLLAATRRITSRDHQVHHGQWNIGQAEPMFRMSGKVLGIVGFGRIARCLAAKARGIGFRSLLVCDPLLDAQAAEDAGVVRVSLETLCREADFISLHVPLSEKTRHLIGAEQLAMMKPTSVLVNTSRGGLIDETALFHALQNRQLFAAGLDVFEQEPIRADHPLLTLSNVICTDHTAWFTEESVIELQRKAAQEVLRVFEGNKPLNWVNR